MALRFKVFGVEVASIELDLPEPAEEPSAFSVVDQGIKAMSRLWVRGMTR